VKIDFTVDVIKESSERHIGSYGSLRNPNFLHLLFKEYEGVSKSFRTGHLERELQMVQISATRCSCIIIL
jgi:hypothetical protein